MRSNSVRGLAELTGLSKSQVHRLRQAGRMMFPAMIDGRDGKPYTTVEMKVARRLAVMEEFVRAVDAGEPHTSRAVHCRLVESGVTQASHSTIGRDLWAMECTVERLEEIREFLRMVDGS